MASSAHHLAQQHLRYPLVAPQHSRDEAVRLPSIKDLNFPFRRHQDPVQIHPSNYPETNQRTVSSWARAVQPQSPQPTHQQQQQHTPPLSAGHEPVNSKIDNGTGSFMPPSVPLSVQSQPTSVQGPLSATPARPDRHRRGSDIVSSRGNPRSPHIAPYHPNYYPHPHPQPAPAPPHASVPYHQIQNSISHPNHHPSQPAVDHLHHVPIPAHPNYPTYQPYVPNRVHTLLHGNPYPSPAPPPASLPQGSWEQQQHHTQPVHVQPHPLPPHQPPQHHLPHSAHVSQTPLQQPPGSQHPQPQPIVSHHPPLPSQHPHPTHPQHPHQHPSSHPMMPPNATLPVQASDPDNSQQYPQHQQVAFSRTASVFPTTTDARAFTVNDSTNCECAMAEIIKHCQALYTFASRYAQIQQTSPEICPPVEELSEMSRCAAEVVRLLEEYRRLHYPEADRAQSDAVARPSPCDPHRPVKRPWEEMSQGDIAEGTDAGPSSSLPEQTYNNHTDKVQTTAEQDMETIRIKRATSATGASGANGQAKSKYRKRSRATPPGKCHSCNIRETPEWRRGPDGARTLCNACGLHYAKLQRKREKMTGVDGEPLQIDLEMLRASTRGATADAEKNQSRKAPSRSQQSAESATSPIEPGSSLTQQQHHTGSFQIIPIIPTSIPSSSQPPQDTGASMGSDVDTRGLQRQHQPQGQGIPPNVTNGGAAVPPPPWAGTNVTPTVHGPRAYAPDQLQHQHQH